MALDALRNTFKDSTVGKAVMAGALALPLTFGSMAANDAHADEAKVGARGQIAEVIKVSTPPAAAEQDEIRTATKREAWKKSKENGGTLVIWYDARHHDDAMATVGALKSLGRQNVIAFAGREDGSFVLIGNGRTIPHKFTLQEARDGTLGGEAMLFADERDIASSDVEGAPSEDNQLTARLT